MTKRATNRPLLLMLYGFPGSGKTYFARQFCDRLQAAHIQADRIRYELFDKPRYDKHENDVVTHLMDYMTEEFLNAEISVVYDVNVARGAQRHSLRDLAHRTHGVPLLIWFQMDAESAYLRNLKRDRRRIDDKYAAAYDHSTFNTMCGQMQNPTSLEDYIVVSGKHTFNTQFNTVLRRLRELGLMTADNMIPVVKPGLVNLIPQPNIQQGRFDPSRRNIIIRQ